MTIKQLNYYYIHICIYKTRHDLPWHPGACQLPDGPASSNTKIYIIILKTYYNFYSNEVVQFAKWTESSFYESHFAGIFLLKQEENIIFFIF